MAKQLLVDLYGCDPELLDSSEQVSAVARSMIHQIGADIVEELVHAFDPVGVTYVAIITTSHLSIHTWPELGYAALDVFSCSQDVPDAIAKRAIMEFGAASSRVQRVAREVGRISHEV